MKAVGYHDSLPISDPHSLLDLDVPEPTPGEHDLLVEVKAVSVNPVDTKVRRRAAGTADQPKILGFDASGVVRAVGAKTSRFRPGDEVWYAGSLQRPGTNSALHVVDERIVGPKPATLGFADAAALPLTAITAWELLFDRLRVLDNAAPSGQSLLVVGAAGGVGSILVQLARQLTGLTVIGTASRPETQAWVRELGAHHVVDHSRPLAAGLREAGLGPVDFVASLTHTDSHFEQLAEAIAPQGRFALIDDPGPIDIGKLKQKSVSVHWEFMFTRAMFGTHDMIRQQTLLAEVSRLVDTGILRTTAGQHFGAINAANLRRAHEHVESGRAQGKVVLEGFAP
ncbi:zinc-binding alcohol dehydrogenase family protein [Chitinasiproducens palmae]|uniref:Zinc-type alcohol dehydrogenase-like protein n=1 Tax=Chitinasiproducens palmae TaxID=1770053 RepID=A0A1H2PNY9_9BURK|nr:zinc-binding alcohol dehydrogenase family protein [Chitinasiproducens palmae]SDV48436.1 zinc-binding alcohol dehydrogenase family protein [Chitinasiproducens palmae]